MELGKLEHINLTVSDPDRTAKLLGDIFGWHIRWSGPALGGGYTVHVGTDDDYVALYSHPKIGALDPKARAKIGTVNHLGVLVEDLEALERKVEAAGLEPFNHQTYEPGRRCYFYDPDNIEYEVVSYTN